MASHNPSLGMRGWQDLKDGNLCAGYLTAPAKDIVPVARTQCTEF